MRRLANRARFDAVPRLGARGARDLIRGQRDNQALLRSFTRLRWVALAAQAATIALVMGAWEVALPLPALLLTLGVSAASNVALTRVPHAASEPMLGAALVFDGLVLTALLALCGGPANPFSVLYLIHVTLAAIMTNRRWTWLVVGVSSAGFGLLFFAHVPLPPAWGGHGHQAGVGPYGAHLQGMWLSHFVAASAIATFVSALSASLREERSKRERTARLLGLATLAAGAAHEIGNPLATIRVAASELQPRLRSAGLPDLVLEDLTLIQQEVDRATAVLRRLAAAAGELTGEGLTSTAVRSLLESVAAQCSSHGASVAVHCGQLPAVNWPVQAVSQALTQLLRNALQASPPGGTVQCRAWAAEGGIAIEVKDCGQGMDSETLERVGEPFFTTQPGDGMGLGVFIARSLLEHLGGRMLLQSQRGRGTVARLWLPLSAGVPGSQ